jgi:hypothetical protein
MAKQQTKATYQARLDRVVDHIYGHLDEDIRPECRDRLPLALSLASHLRRHAR